jgi:hypothetical protein
MTSEPYLISHLDQIRIGSTLLQAHFCEECEICEPLDEISVDPTAELKKIKCHKRMDGVNDVVASGEAYIGWKADYERKKLMTIPVLRTPQTSFDMFNINEEEFLQNTTERIVSKPNLLQSELNTPISIRIPKTSNNPPIQFSKGINLESLPPPSSSSSSSRHHNHKYKPYKPVIPIVRASLDVKISSGNKGSELLKKMGWKEGSGLGATSSGIVDPIDLVKPRGKSGLGYSRKKI